MGNIKFFRLKFTRGWSGITYEYLIRGRAKVEYRKGDKVLLRYKLENTSEGYVYVNPANDIIHLFEEI